MKALSVITALTLLLISFQPVNAVDLSGFEKLTKVMDSGLVVEANIFSPKTWKKAAKEYQNAKALIDRGRDQSSVDKEVTRSREYAENAIKATEVAKLSLKEYLPPRNKAKTAKGPVLVPELYEKAEDQFVKATRKVESGDVKGGLKEAEKSVPLFDVAEMEAIRVDILGAADKLIEKARADKADKFALATLDKAKGARKRGNDILTKDRYNRTEAVAQAQLAEYEARHAANIALSVRSLKRNDQAWEKLMLLYEIQMNRVGEAAGLGYLPFDNGPLEAANKLIENFESLQSENEQLKTEAAAMTTTVGSQLRQTLAQLGQDATSDDLIDLSSAVDKQVSDMLVDQNRLSQQYEASSTMLAELSQEHQETSAELQARLAREEKFKKAKSILNPSEGEVLFNSSNDIVLRLSGLSFDIGKSDIKDEHIPILEKVKKIVEMFPGTRLVVEGHTDASGDPSANVHLSEKRAFAVMQYLRQSLLIPADKIQSIGYGADKPIATNKTSDGRAKNRRIDILVMQ